MNHKILGLLISASIFSALTAQAMIPKTPPITTQDRQRANEIGENWPQKDWAKDKIPGTSTELLRRNVNIGKPTQPIIVAVIDSGVDIAHESLKDVIWTNPGEAGALANNGIDDDHNGYIDDVHGWNFLGNNAGGMVDELAYEAAREEARLAEIQKQRPLTEDEAAYLAHVKTIDFAGTGMEKDQSRLIDESPGGGNNNVIGNVASHGTHCAGIIAAQKNNSNAMVGQATDVRIMVLRAVPADGDERDLEISKAIHYAVNNGAKIISMSFGRYLSPKQNLMDAALKHAQSKGLLLVHAAGNETRDLDQIPNFPSRKLLSGEEVTNFIDVGSTDPYTDDGLMSSFSNYGEKNVDVFAPGGLVLSTVPDQKFDYMGGTSMAAPEVAGVAALLWAQAPQATALEIKNALLANVNRFDDVVAKISERSLMDSLLGGDKVQKEISFWHLSASGGVVNAYRAYQALLKSGKIAP